MKQLLDEQFSIEALIADEDETAHEGLVDFLTASENYRVVMREIETVQSSVTALESIQDFMLANPDMEYTPEMNNILQISIESHEVILTNTFAGLLVPAIAGFSQEAFDSGYDMEGIGRVISKMAAGIRDAFLVATKAFSDVVVKAFSTGRGFVSDAKLLRNRLDAKTETLKSDKMKISNAHTLHVAGKTDTKSIVEGIDNAATLLEAVTGPYLDSIYDHYSNTLKGYISMTGQTSLALQRGQSLVDEMDQKLLKEFNDDVEVSLSKALKVLPKTLEISGGRVFGIKNTMGISTVPDLFKRDKRNKVSPKQTIDVPSHKEIGQMLDSIEQIGKLMVERKKGILTAFLDIQESMDKGMDDSAGMDVNIILKYLNKIGIGGRMMFSHTWYTTPINDTVSACFSSARSVANLCDDAIDKYE